MIDYSIIGKRFGRLTVIELDHIGNYRSTWWKCHCDCGKEVVVYRGSLTSGDTVSCGCYHEEFKKEFSKTHGLSGHPLYIVWNGMIQRCTSITASNYERYGGRGITVCDEWRTNFEEFYNWAINNGYEYGLTIDRIDNSLGYFPDNCRWVSRIEQQNNTRRNHKFTYGGETHSVAEWSRMLNVNHETLRYRIMHDNLLDFERYYGRDGDND